MLYRLINGGVYNKWGGNNLYQNSPHLSYVLGSLLGDGFLYKHKGAYLICLKVKSELFAKSFQGNLVEIGLKSSLYHDRRCDMWHVTAYSRLFYIWYKSLGIEPQRGPKQGIGSVWDVIRPYPIDFVRGFYEAEGSYSHTICERVVIRGANLSEKYNQYTLSIGNTNLELIGIVQNILDSSGFNTRLSKKILPSKKIFGQIFIKGGKVGVNRFFELIKPCIKNGEIQVTRLCQRCGQEYVPTHSRQNYCKTCSKPIIKRNCRICGKEFIVWKTGLVVCCSQECSKLFKRKYMREYVYRRYHEDPEFRQKMIEANS